MSTNENNSGIWSTEVFREPVVIEKKHATFFIFMITGLGGLTRILLLNSPVPFIRTFPYTIVMVFYGALFGVLQMIPMTSVPLEPYLHLTSFPAKGKLTLFLPVIIFNSAFDLKMHLFKKNFLQAAFLAGPVNILTIAATAGFVVLLFDWNIICAMTLAATLGATDPVKSGGPGKFGSFADSKCLMTNGLSILLFNMFVYYAKNDSLQGFIYFIKTIFLSPLLGFGLGIICKFLISHCYDDVKSQTLLTISFSYIGYILGDGLLEVSGIMIVMIFSLTLSANKTAITPRVYPIMYRIWDYLTYMVNTTIFFMAGFAIGTVAYQSIGELGLIFAQSVAVFVMVFFLRAIMDYLFFPLTFRMGEVITLRTCFLLTASCLRGGIGLTLALAIQQIQEDDFYWHETNHNKNQDLKPKILKDKPKTILIWTMCVVLFAIIIHSWTNARLIAILEVGKLSMAKLISLQTACEKIQDLLRQERSLLQNDQFLVEADWKMVDSLVNFRNVSSNVSVETFLQRQSKCPECETMVINNPSKREVKELVEETRTRLTFLARVSYLNQYQSGKITQSTTHLLHEQSEMISETSNCYLDIEKTIKQRNKAGHAFISSSQLKKKKNKQQMEKEIKSRTDLKMGKSMQILKEDQNDKKNLKTTQSIRDATRKEVKDEYQRRPEPSNPSNIDVPKKWKHMTAMERLTKIEQSIGFEIFFITVILINVIPIIYEISDPTGGTCKNMTLQGINYGFLVVYILEYIIRIVVEKKDYIPGSVWGFIDTFVLLVGLVTLMTNLQTMDRPDKGTKACDRAMKEAAQEEGTEQKALFFIKILKFLRLIRIFRLVRFLIPSDSKFLQRLVNNALHQVYEFSSALTAAQQDTKMHLKKVPISAYPPLAETAEARVNINVFLGQKASLKLIENNLGVEVSVRTKQAATNILNAAINRLQEIGKMGLLDDHHFLQLKKKLEKMKLDLRKIPSSLDEPPLIKSLKLVPWLENERMMEFFVRKSKIVEFSSGSMMQRANDFYNGIYIIASGSIQVKGEAGIMRYYKHLSKDFNVNDEMDLKRTELLARDYQEVLMKPDKLLKDLQDPLHHSRTKVLGLEMQFVTRGFILNNINIVVPTVSIRDAICTTPVTAYFLTKDKVDEMLETFSTYFETFRDLVWKELYMLYLTKVQFGIRYPDIRKVNRSFVIIIDKDHFTDRSGRIVFNNDPIHYESVFLLVGICRIGDTEEIMQGPVHMPAHLTHLVFAVPKSESDTPRLLITPRDLIPSVMEIKSAAVEVVSAGREKTKRFVSSMTLNPTKSKTKNPFKKQDTLQVSKTSVNDPKKKVETWQPKLTDDEIWTATAEKVKLDLDSGPMIIFKTRISQILKVVTKFGKKGVTLADIILDREKDLYVQ